MRHVNLKRALQGAFVAAAVVAAGSAPAIARGAFRTTVSAKIAYCQDCHGRHGQGFLGYYPIPRLAGQRVQYIKDQLAAFIHHTRTNNIMFNVAHVLSPAMRNALAERFHHFNPPPLGGASRRLAAEGKEIFQNGLPDHNVPACAACHGPDARGHDHVPRLAGQLAPYVIKELTNWGSIRAQQATMLPVAHSLSRQEMRQVAAYVSGLR